MGVLLQDLRKRYGNPAALDVPPHPINQETAICASPA